MKSCRTSGSTSHGQMPADQHQDGHCGYQQGHQQKRNLYGWKNFTNLRCTRIGEIIGYQCDDERDRRQQFQSQKDIRAARCDDKLPPPSRSTARGKFVGWWGGACHRCSVTTLVLLLCKPYIAVFAQLCVRPFSQSDQVLFQARQYVF